MATSERPAQNVEDAEPKETRQAPYNRQTTNFGYPIYREPRAGGQRVLVRRPSVDLAQLTRQRSRAIIENFFRKSSPPVLEGLSDDFLDKISDVELRKKDYQEAQHQAVKRKELHAELRTEVAKPHRHRHKRRFHTHRRFRNRVKLVAVEDVCEAQEHSINGGVDKKFQHFEEKTTATITTGNHVTNHKELKERKPKLITNPNPFDAEFAVADRGARRIMSDPQQSQKEQVNIAPEGADMLKKPQNPPSSDDGDTQLNGVSCHTQHKLDNVDCEISDFCSSKITRMTSITDGADGVTSTSTVEVTNVQENIVIHPQDNIMMSSDLLPESEAVQSSGTPAADTPTSKTSKLSTGSFHLDLTYEHGSASDVSNFSNDEEDNEDDCEVKKKPNHLVADTPVEVDGPLPCRFRNIPFYSEIEKELGHIPTFAEYFSYRLDKITVDLEYRYPDLDKCYQQVISGFRGALTYEVFHQAAMRVQSRAEMMYDGVFIVLNFGKYLFQQFPEYASNYTTQWVDDYIIHQGGWDRVTDMYYEEQLTPSPVTTIEMIGASGVSEESLNDALSQDECNSEQLNSTDGQRVPSIQVIRSNTSSHHKKPANVSPPVWDISSQICFPILNRSCSVEVLPRVPEDESEEQHSTQSSKVEKENNSDHVTDVTQITPECHSSNGARLISHRSLENNNSPQTTHGHVHSYYPIRRSNSAPNLTRVSLVATPTSPTHSDDDDGAPPPGQHERRRSSLQSLQDFNDVFLSCIPYIAGAAAPTVVAVHFVMEVAKRMSSS